MTSAPNSPAESYCSDPQLDAAVRYALEVPGKQLRSQLTVTVATMLDPDSRAGAERVGRAIELLHTYSLLHDDLPAMDDDDLRRGRPTLHRAFDEATAILVGDGLQALAFEQLASIDDLPAATRLELIRIISRAVGLRGMVGGQALDLAAEGRCIDQQALRELHSLKTGALIVAAVDAGALCASASSKDRALLTDFGHCIGLGFQVIDDVLDVTASRDALGKTPGKDVATAKSTYVTQLGLDGARDEAQRLLGQALECLSGWGDAAAPVIAIARRMIDRGH